MKKRTRIIAGLLALLTAVTICSCGKKTTFDSKDVRLKWLTAGPGKQKDTDLVWKTFNEKLNEKMPGVQIDFEILPIGDYAEKWRLMIAANEKIDIAWNGYVQNYADEVKKGAYLPLNDYLEEYAPNLYKSMPDWIWENMKVDGKIYAVPCYQMMVSRPSAFKVFKEDAEKYLDYEGLQAEFEKPFSAGAPSLSEKSFDIIEDYLTKLDANGIKHKGFAPYIIAYVGEIECTSDSLENGMGLPCIETTYLTLGKDGRPIANDACAPDVTDVFYKRMAQMYKKGFIRNDVLTAADIRSDEGKDGGYAIWFNVYDAFTEQQESIAAGKDIKVIPRSKNYVRSTSPFATNNALPRTCQNLEKAMSFLELFNNPKDTELYNLLVYGIEDKHYKKVGENRIETLDYTGSPTIDSNYGVQKWILGDTFNAYLTQGDVDGYNEYVKNDMNVNAVDSPLAGFVFDKEPVKVELAQIASVKKEYYGLRYGTYSNWEEKLKEYREKIQKCGQQKVIEEVQKQLDVWYESQK